MTQTVWDFSISLIFAQNGTIFRHLGEGGDPGRQNCQCAQVFATEKNETETTTLY